jgi:hypothetical protein
MAMDPKVAKELEQEAYTPFHRQLLQDTKALVDMSRRHMQLQYDKWDHNSKVFDLWYHLDQQDRKARERKEPEKQVFPLSYSQQMAFIAFCFTVYTQRERFFEVEGMNQESHKPAKIAEVLLARDLGHNQFQLKLYQFLLDIARFGIGIWKTAWRRETQRLKVQINKEPFISFLGMSLGGGQTEEEQIVTKYLGNDLMNVTPYRFFPDTRLPLRRFQEGEFVGSEDEYAYVALKQMEKQGELVGCRWLKPFTKKMLADRGQSRFSDDVNIIDSDISTHAGQTKGSFVLTEVQRTFIPNEYQIDGKPLGKEDYPCKYLISYVNDTRIVRCEPLQYAHDQFTYSVGQYSPDILHLLSQSLSDSVDGLQSLVSWFINSRITNVRKVISDKLIVDPEGIELKDLQDRNPIIRLKPSAARQGVDKFIKQLELQDVTQNHLKDAQYLEEFTQKTTGINENILGQFYPGRRSATENRNVNSAAASRLKMVASLLFEQTFIPMGEQMISNLRDGLDEETFVKLQGIAGMQDAQGFQKVTRADLVGSYDFEMFDGTLPSEKNILAGVLEQVVMEGMKAPELAVAWQLDLRAMLLEAMELRGIRNPLRFTLQQPPQQPGQPGQPPQPGQPQGQPMPAPSSNPGPANWAGDWPAGTSTRNNMNGGSNPGMSHGIQDLIQS